MSQSEPGAGADEAKRGFRQLPIGRAIAAAVLGPALLAFLQPASPWVALAVALLCAALCLVPAPHAGKAKKEEASARGGEASLPPVAGAVLDAFPEPVVAIDRHLHVRHANPVATRNFGEFSVGEAIALRFRSPEFLSALEIAVGTDGGGKATLVEGRSSGRVWAVDVAPLAVAQGQTVPLFLLILHDRSAERRIDRMRTDFVANASHELRTPLASLIGFIETLQGPAREDKVARERFLAIMREQAARMSRLIDDLLSLSQLEMKRPPPPGRTVDLAELLEDVQGSLAPMIEDSGLAIETDFAAGDHVVDGDRDELLQVFSNLLENALKYGASGGRVVLSLATDAEDPNSVRATVRDFGRGIAAEHVPRLTERFYRVDVESSRTQRGTGLGLAIVRNILARHGARLAIWSEPGQGSAFSAILRKRKKTDREQQVRLS
ncbi:ATP-binding protein [Aureimonas psammosilenae]|uniref:ATP-binding protein n=1 Tax=Aureimonas psammosilenae TaxID=2495496 RepID=UPI0012613A91|nr:ATP-binding protein [Aureimonas psammosilenae]